MAHTPIAARGGPDAWFQLDGEPPVECRLASGKPWDYADAHFGFYGYLRVASIGILRRVGTGLIDLADRLWRCRCDERELWFCGTLRITATRILLRIGVGLLDLSTRVWRSHYASHLHPVQSRQRRHRHRGNLHRARPVTRHRMRLVEQLVEEDSGDFAVEAPTPELAAGILVAAYDARDQCEDLVVLSDGQSQQIEPTDVVRTRVFCVLLDEAGQEVREVEPDRPNPTTNDTQPATTESSP